MAVDDVFRTKCSVEGREGEWHMTWHHQELTPASLGIATAQLAEGLSDHISATLRACLSKDHQISRFQVDKLSGTKTPNSTFSPIEANRVGLELGEALPASSAVHCTIGQTLFDPASNGKFHLSGVPADQVTGSVLDAAYQLTPISNFLIQIHANVPEPSAGDGLWRLGVLSRKFLLANPGDYVGAFADAVTIGFSPRLGRMRSRGFGGRRRTPAPVV